MLRLRIAQQLLLPNSLYQTQVRHQIIHNPHLTMSTKTVLVTGSSSGFGNTLVNLFLRQGHNALATSRSPERTPDLVSSVDNHPSGRGKWLQLDLTWSQSKITSTVIEAAQIFGPIDVLINNAGYAVMATIEDVDEEKAKTQSETNYWRVIRMLKAVLPSMRERKQGTIVNVSSIAGLTANPTVGVYAGSKFALEGKYSHSPSSSSRDNQLTHRPKALSESVSPEVSPSTSPSSSSNQARSAPTSSIQPPSNTPPQQPLQRHRRRKDL